MHIAAIVLAAGRSTRMERRDAVLPRNSGPSKLLLPFRGAPLLAHAVDSVLAAGVREVVVVTGRDADAVAQALAPRALSFAYNPQFELGLSTSLRTGLGALPAGVDGVLVCLGDMPFVRARDLRELIAAFERSAGEDICIPMHAGRRGNPLLWPARMFEELSALQGDTGGRSLLDAHASRIRRVEIDSDGVLLDIDTAQELESARSKG